MTGPSLTPEQQARVDAVCEHAYSIADRIGAHFTAEYERLLREDPFAIRDTRYGFTDKDGVVNFERAPIKYAINARAHMQLKLRYLPFLKHIRSAFDIGVGSGQMIQLLRDALGIAVTGIDAPDSEGAFLYEAFRQELGIVDKVGMLKVTAGTEVPIPCGDTALCLWPIFDREWTVDEHAWFMDMCKRRSAERVIWRFNMRNASESILAFYREQLNACTPREKDPGFLIVEF